jgi:hypothetical protein
MIIACVKVLNADFVPTRFEVQNMSSEFLESLTESRHACVPLKYSPIIHNICFKIHTSDLFSHSIVDSTFTASAFVEEIAKIYIY